MRPLSLVFALGGAALSLVGGLTLDGALQQRQARLQELRTSLAMERLCHALELSGMSQGAGSTGAVRLQGDGARLCGQIQPPSLPGVTGHPSRSLGWRSSLSASKAVRAQWLSAANRPTGGLRVQGLSAPAMAAGGSDATGDLGVLAPDDDLLAAGSLPPRLNATSVDKLLVATLMALGLGLSAGLAIHHERNSRRRQRLQASLQVDPQTDLPSLQALERDLDELLRSHETQATGMAMLVTLNLQILERQRAFLSDAQVGETLRQCCAAIRYYRPDWLGLRFYRISDHRLAILTRSVAETRQATSKDACETILQSLLHDACEATIRTLHFALHWDDIIVTGQRLGSSDSRSRLLTNHAFGERVAGEDQVAYRMVEANDEQRGRVDTEISSTLLELGPSDVHFRFQPILLLSDPGRFGLELLLRFRPEVLAKVGTATALRCAHDLGIAHKIDELVISQLPEVQEWLRGNPDLSPRVAYVSVNISSDSLATPRNLDALVETLRRHEIDNSLFCLEITETAATHQLPGVNHVRTASERLIKELAFRVYIDDFGSGLSNYRRICEAWYDVIKLDIGLIKGISDSFRLQHYVGSFIESVHALGKTVIAEGIEDANDLQTVVRLRADCLQGYRISKPLSRSGLVQFLTTSDWANPSWLERFLSELRDSDRLLSSHQANQDEPSPRRIPLERLLLENWSQLRSYEEFVLLFVNELRLWGLDIMRLSLAFLPEEEDIDCSQYIWNAREPGEVRTLRMERDFLEHNEHRSSPLHRIASTGQTMRRRLNQMAEPDFELLAALKQQGCTDYVGIRLESRGISIPVLTIALQRQSVFSDDQVKRIESMSNLLSLLFYTFESERAKRMALLDPLTGLANRRSFDSFLRANIASCRCNGQPLALALIDIDRFKAVNDLMGHAYGDRALRKVAAILGGNLQKRSDFLARLGGEEFGLIMPDTDADRAIELCSNMRMAIESAEIDHPQAVSGNVLTISIGIGLWTPQDGDCCDSDSLQQLADDCLYAAKHAGRNRVQIGGFQGQDRVPSSNH